jgi:putative MATE family efflux protein
MSQKTLSLTEIGVPKAIARLATPVVLANLGQTAVEWAILGMLGTLGAESLAAVGFSRTVFWWAISWLFAFGMGIMALVARSVGAGDEERARRTIVQAFLVGFVVTGAVAVVGISGSRFALPLMGAEPKVVRLGIPYLNTLFISVPFMINFFFGIFALRALGDAQVTLWLQGAVGLVQLVMSRLLIFGWGPFPRLGLVGGGMAIVLSRVVGLIGVGYVLFSGASRIRLRREDLTLRPHWPTLRSLAVVSMPNAIEWLGADTQKVLLLRIIAATGEGSFAVSAVTVGRQVEELFMTIGMGMASAAGTLVGQNLGARKPERAQESARRACLITIAMFALASVPFLLFPQVVVRLFSNDPDVLALGSLYLVTLGITSPGYAASMVYAGSLRGAGDTRSPMSMDLILLWLVQLPLAYALGLLTPLGIRGIYISFGLFWAIYGIWLKQRFDAGRWKHISV